MDRPPELPAPVIERLSAYRRHLRYWLADGRERIFSHELGGLINSTPPQVRRDLMTIGCTGSPARGYDAQRLIDCISNVLDAPAREALVLVGLGYLGRAVLRYLTTTHPEFPILATFDTDPQKIDRVIDGCHCYATTRMKSVLKNHPALIGIITVPAAAAQDVADQLVRANVRGILNFATVRLRVPPEVFTEDLDISISLEKVAFFARAKPTRLQKRG